MTSSNACNSFWTFILISSQTGEYCSCQNSRKIDLREDRKARNHFIRLRNKCSECSLERWTRFVFINNFMNFLPLMSLIILCPFPFHFLLPPPSPIFWSFIFMTSYGFGSLSVFYSFFPSNLGVQAKRESTRQGHRNYIQVRGNFFWTGWPRRDPSEIACLKQGKEQRETQASGGLWRGPKTGKSFRGPESLREIWCACTLGVGAGYCEIRRRHGKLCQAWEKTGFYSKGNRELLKNFKRLLREFKNFKREFKILKDNFKNFKKIVTAAVRSVDRMMEESEV